MATRTVGILKSNKRRRSEQMKLIIKEKKKQTDQEELCNKPSTASDGFIDNNKTPNDGRQAIISRLNRCPKADVDNLVCLVEHCRRRFKEPLILAFHLSYSHIDRARCVGRDTTCLVCGKVCSSGRMLSLHAHLSHRALSDKHAAEMRALSKFIDCRAAANKERELNWIAKSKTFNYYSDGHFEDEDYNYACVSEAISDEETESDEDEIEEDVGVDDENDEEEDMFDYPRHQTHNFTFGGGGITRIIDLPIIHWQDDSLTQSPDSAPSNFENEESCQTSAYHLPENEENRFNSIVALAPSSESDPDPDASYDEVVEFEKDKLGVSLIVLPPGLSNKIAETGFTSQISSEKETLIDVEEEMAAQPKLVFDDSTCNIQEFFESPINPESQVKLLCQVMDFSQHQQKQEQRPSQNQPGFLPIIGQNMADWGHVTQLQ